MPCCFLMSAQVSLFGHFIKYVSSLMLVCLFFKQSEKHFSTQDKKRSLQSLGYNKNIKYEKPRYDRTFCKYNRKSPLLKSRKFHGRPSLLVIMVTYMYMLCYSQGIYNQRQNLIVGTVRPKGPLLCFANLKKVK